MSFRAKITVCMVWLLALAFGVGASLLISMSFRSALDREKASAFRTYQVTMQALKLVNDAESQSDYADAVSTLEQMEEKTDWSALRLGTEEETLYTSGSLLRDADLPGALEPGTCLISSVAGGSGKYLILSGLIEAGTDTLRLDAAYDISPVYADRDQQQAAYQRIFIILAAAGALLSYVMTMLLTRPLGRLGRASRELAGGNMAYRADVRTRDEIGRLAGDFNNMADKVERSMTELQDAMERQERFMGSFAHEMKTPMTSIIGYADLMRSRALTEAEQQDAANYIFSEGRRLESLSLKLLDIIVQKNRAPELSPESPARLISGLASHLKTTLKGEGIDLQYKCQEGLCLLEPDLFKTLIVNLIDNARKAMERGGNIYIISKMTADGCTVSVADNGRGIPPEALAHLTEAFYRVDKSRSRAQGGAGLGLSLCNEIVEMHGGTLTFKSRVGNGTIVTAVLKGGAL